jgi:hypothetical protein
MTIEPRTTIACPGCGRTQTVRRSRLTRCDIYTCGLGRCSHNPEYKLPERPNDLYMVEHVLNAAGGFSGVKFRLMTPEDYASIQRARVIMEAGRKKLAEE